MLKDYIRNPYRVFMLLGDRGLLNWLGDEPFLRLIYRANIGQKLNLENPQTFCEKMNWLKLYGHPERYTLYSDKLGVRAHVAKALGEEYLVPLLGVWDDPDEIDFDALPERFVLKATHDSGSAYFCRDRADFDRQAARKKLRRALRTPYYMKGRERQYEHVVPRVIAEAYLDSGTDALAADYKVYCFDGEARFVHLATDRGTDRHMKITIFDPAWNRLPFWIDGYPTEPGELPRPEGLEEMIRCAEKLCAGMPFMRVDFYEVAGRVYFGEMSWLPSGGLIPFQPPEWERRLGDWVTLPPKDEGDGPGPAAAAQNL